MLRKSDSDDMQDARPFIPAMVLRGDLSLGLLIVVDHGFADLPSEYGTLGLSGEEFERHIAYDIGIEGVATYMNDELNVPVVQAKFSRLLIDPNRGVDDPTLIMKLSDGAVIPGNADIDVVEREHRIDNFYHSYHKAVGEQIDAFLDKGIVPILISLHSFTASWRGDPRHWHSAILWDKDPRLAQPLIAALREDDALIVGDNEPYTGRLVGDCMYQHGTSRGIAHALVEIRQDLIGDPGGQKAWGERLSLIMNRLINDESVIEPCREIKTFGSYVD